MMNSEFSTQQLNEKGIERVKAVKEKFNELLEYLKNDTELLPGRGLSVVRTKLEEACFFAVKEVANQNENQR
jgi:hypothetical protein